MHDLIQEMGWKVVQESAPNSRLWQLEKIHNLIGKWKNPNSWLCHLEKMHDIRKTKNGELEVIEGIVVPREEIDQGFGFSPHVFESMTKLRILEVNGYFTWFKPTFLPDELRWFCWENYPFSSLPVAHMSKLVGLEMMCGKIKHLWKGEKMMLQNLKFINLHWCEFLKRFPDVSGAPNIERLDLSGCENMVEVDESVGSLKKLLHLDMSGCNKLKCLPSMLHMESLETLILDCCWSLKRIPEFSLCMVNLSHLDISRCYKIKEVPSSIKYLSNLTHLDLEGCRRLKNIPNSIWELKCLNTLNLSDCEELQKLPDDFQSILVYLEELHIDSINIHVLTNFSSLRRLRLRGDITDSDFPINLHGLSSLEELSISDNSELIQLPESISHLSSLKQLQLGFCHRLQTIQGFPSGIQALMVDGCYSLEKIEDLSEKYECLSKIWISRSRKLIKGEENERYVDKMLEQSFFKKWAAVDGCVGIKIPKSNIPSWFKEQHEGCRMTLKLPPKWKTKIIGFAICFVTWGYISDKKINFKFENDGVFTSNPKADNINEIEEAVNENTFICYIPFSLLKLDEDNDNDFKGEDWFHMTKGNLVFEILTGYLETPAVRCGGQVVYKEDVTSIQQTIHSVSSPYWSWKLTKRFTNSFTCHLTL